MNIIIKNKDDFKCQEYCKNLISNLKMFLFTPLYKYHKLFSQFFISFVSRIYNDHGWRSSYEHDCFPCAPHHFIEFVREVPNHVISSVFPTTTNRSKFSPPFLIIWPK